ncbi:MAG: hypothetical protein ACKO3W_10615 [bacterium]
MGEGVLPHDAERPTKQAASAQARALLAVLAVSAVTAATAVSAVCDVFAQREFRSSVCMELLVVLDMPSA